MKPASPKPRWNEVPDEAPPLGLLSGQEVQLSSNRRTILVSMAYESASDGRECTIHFALAPPSAAQLSRDLKKAVKEYLHHTSDAS